MKWIPEKIHKPRLLVVDDDKIILKILSELLADSFQITVAKTGEAAVFQAANQIDLIILDWELPDTTGLEVCRQLKKSEAIAHIPVVFLTGHQDPEIEEKGISAGAVDFIVKPFSAAVLKARLQTHLELAFKTEELQRLALTDSLTKLPNRNLFNDRLAQAQKLANRNQSRFAVMFMDLDYFKQINDTHGHAAGDYLLISVSRRLTELLRKTDTVSRQGGDEFVILLSNINQAKDAKVVAQKIINKIADPFHFKDHEINITVSMGLATYPDDGDDCEELLQRADSALYHSKRQGRNCLTVYSSTIHQAELARKALQEEIRVGLERQEFVPHFQPIMDLNSGQLIGFEVLARWEIGNEIKRYPDQFIPVAEECGLIGDLGHAMLEQACKQLAAWGNDDIYISINVSAVQLEDESFTENVKKCLKQYAVHGHSMIFEFTESALMKSRDQAIVIMQTLHEMDIQIAIDDFGTGFACLNNLKDFPVDIVKIDKCFIQDLDKSQFDRELVQALINLADKIQLSVIAEGVETEEQQAILKKMRCKKVQGYYYGKPTNALLATELLHTNVPKLVATNKS